MAEWQSIALNTRNVFGCCVVPLPFCTAQVTVKEKKAAPTPSAAQTTCGQAYSGATFVQAEGYPMDNFCIDNTVMLDNPTIKSLEFPNKHTLHCLVEITRCVDSGYTLLKPPATTGGLYTIRYQLGKAGTEVVKAAGEKAAAASSLKFKQDNWKVGARLRSSIRAGTLCCCGHVWVGVQGLK